MFNDLRGYLKKVQELGEHKVVEGADWNLEIGAITGLNKSIPNSPLLEFDKIKGCKAGYRVISNVLNTPRRLALALGLPLEAKGVELARAWRSKTEGEVKLIPPVEVKTGPVKENTRIGEDVDIFEFPVPKWHELDGGRYIGTGCLVIQKDPDEGWVNLGTYRVQAYDRNTATVHIVDGHHGDLIRRKYWDRGLAAPAVVVCGQDPLLWFVASSPIPWGISEYDYTGWLRTKPVEVVKGEVTNLPIPATAEIALEGELVLPDTETRVEGPFGEWQGYFAGQPRVEPVFKVKAILYRNNPILMGSPNFIGPYDFITGGDVATAATVWAALDRQVPGVTGVWMPSDVRGGILLIIAIKQMYPGHAKQVGMLAAGCYAAAAVSRFIIIVDDDIDPSNIGDVLWAVTTRCDPESAIDILSGTWTMRSDPLLSPEKRSRDQIEASKAIIYACRPYHWLKDFPPSSRIRPELLEEVRKKFPDVARGTS